MQQHFHFIGISGIGMSGIAKILMQQGHTVSGCDKNIDGKHIQELQALGCIISSKHQSEICNNLSISTIIHTSAISKQHPEIQQAIQNGIPVLLRAEMLAEIMKHQTSIAVSGSHGKTSTTALLAHILESAKLKPSFIVGGHVNSMNTNASHGSGKYLIAEADESDRSLLKLPKNIALTTNVDLEHLETYKDFNDIRNTFATFLNSTPNYGHNIICIDDAGIHSILPILKKPYSTYGTTSEAEIQAQNIILNKNESTFDIFQKSTNKILGSISLPEPGIHYVLNATGAITTALHINIPFATIKTALTTFSGVDRRFTYKGASKIHQAHIFDDYGHHPKEIKHALAIARKKAQNELIVAFQPHRFTRTKHLWNDFVKLFTQSHIDTLIITDIYAANENPIEGISSSNLVQAIQAQNPNLSVLYCPIDNQFQQLFNLLNKKLKTNDLLLFLGAGKIHKLSEKLL